jgi:ADP-ribose pyrophosphatase
LTSTDSNSHPSEPEIPELASSELIYENRVIRLERDMVRFHDGHEAERVVIRHPGAVALVVLDENEHWLVIRQYRHPAGKPLLEIPAGTREDGEPPEETASREVREETGYAARSLVRLGGAWMAPGFMGEYIDFYLATDLHESPLPQDHDEYISPPERLTEAEVEAAVAAGEIEDAKTMVALTLMRMYRAGDIT